LLVGNWL